MGTGDGEFAFDNLGGLEVLDGLELCNELLPNGLADPLAKRRRKVRGTEGDEDDKEGDASAMRTTRRPMEKGEEKGDEKEDDEGERKWKGN